MASPNRPYTPPPQWCVTDDPYDAPGKDWDGVSRILDPGTGPREDGYSPEDQPGARELNHDFRRYGEWLNYVSEIQLMNWSVPLATAIGDIKTGAWSPGPTSGFPGGGWYLLLDNGGGGVYSRTGKEWAAAGTPPSLTVPRLFNGVGNAAHYLFTGEGNGGNDILHWWTGPGGSWVTQAMTTDDIVWCGCAFNNRIIVLGHYDGDPGLVAGKVFFARAQHDALTVWTRSTTDTTMTSPAYFCIATSGARAVALVSTASRTDMWTSSDGATWVYSASVSGLSGKAVDVCYDPNPISGPRWLALTEDDGIYSSPVGSESWTQIVDAETFVDGPAATPHRIACIAGLYVVTASDSAFLFFSADLTVWHRYRVTESDSDGLTGLAYSTERQQWVVANAANAYASLGVGFNPYITA